MASWVPDISALTLLGVVLLAGFFMGRLARRLKLPALIGYMLFGVCIGPSVMDLFDAVALAELSFLAEVGLGFVAFSIGTELSLRSLRRLGGGIVACILASSLLAFVAVAVMVYFFSGDLPLALLLAAMAPATAPAGTVAVIQELRASGSLTKSIYAVVGFDDGVAVIIYGLTIAVVKVLLVGGDLTMLGGWHSLTTVGREIGGSLLLGSALGLLVSEMVRRLRQSSELLIVIVGTVLLATGLALHFHLSLIIVNMAIGFLLVNTRRETLAQRVRGPLLELMPLVFILFFTLAGAHLDLAAMPALGGIGLVFILGRSLGKVAGAGLGAALGRMESKVFKYLGWALLSQAGVAIGLALLANNELLLLADRYQMPRAETLGAAVLAIITTTSVFFEIVGPLLMKFVLIRSGEVHASVDSEFPDD